MFGWKETEITILTPEGKKEKSYEVEGRLNSAYGMIYTQETKLKLGSEIVIGDDRLTIVDLGDYKAGNAFRQYNVLPSKDCKDLTFDGENDDSAGSE